MKTSSAALALVLGLSMGSAQAATETIDLAFILDSSGSVGSSNFTDAKNALATALSNNVPAPTAEREYRITVVNFSTTATKVVDSVVWNDDNDDTILSSISGMTFSNGFTCYSCAMDLLGEIDGIGIVNMMTDGNPNRPTIPNNGISDEQDARNAANAARDAMRARGWDSLSFEAVEPPGSTAIDIDYLKSLGFDTGGIGVPEIAGPGDILDPLNSSFVLKILDFGESYEAAVAKKIQKIDDPTPAVPVPAALPLMAAGLGMFGVVRLRRRKTA